MGRTSKPPRAARDGGRPYQSAMGRAAGGGLQVEVEELGLHPGVNLAREGERFKARNEITALLKPWFRAHRVEDFARSFDEHGVTWSVFRSFKRVVEEDPDLLAA